jgi:hypothetical protein
MVVPWRIIPYQPLLTGTRQAAHNSGLGLIHFFGAYTMKQWLGFPSVQIALCTACFGLLGYWMLGNVWGKIQFLFLAIAYGSAISRPLINLIASMRYAMRASVWLPLHGQHYVYKNTTLRVLEDEDSWRWVKLSDVELVLGVKLNARLMGISYPERLLKIGRPAHLHMRDDALIEYLSKKNDDMALRFRTWLERNVALPARRMRERSGVRDPASKTSNEADE